ncbi:hypothetical protein ACFL5B_03385 [Candidatus Latescibacterota bacterium]
MLSSNGGHGFFNAPYRTHQKVDIMKHETRVIPIDISSPAHHGVVEFVLYTGIL